MARGVSHKLVAFNSSVSHVTQLVKAREAERKKAIADGKMDDPLVQKSLKDAITMVGTCKDMCPRFERYRRERESNLSSEWETVRICHASGYPVC